MAQGRSSKPPLARLSHYKRDNALFENFTRRNHLDHFETDLQYEFVPPPFRYDLFKTAVEEDPEDRGIVGEYSLYRGAAISINTDYYRFYSVEEIEEHYSADLFIDLLLKAEWHELLSIVEFLINNGHVRMSQVNQLFGYHNVGYEVEKHGRRDYRVIVKYSALIADNERVLSSGIPYPPVVQAISAAKEALIDPLNIDVATSIKLSVDAVEAYLKGWLEERGRSVPTLDDAIKEMKRQSLCPGHILDSLLAFYVYRNRTENVGHGSPRFAELGREDALLCNEMSVSLINYFHRKGNLLGGPKPRASAERIS